MGPNNLYKQETKIWYSIKQGRKLWSSLYAPEGNTFCPICKVPKTAFVLKRGRKNDCEWDSVCGASRGFPIKESLRGHSGQGCVCVYVFKQFINF